MIQYWFGHFDTVGPKAVAAFAGFDVQALHDRYFEFLEYLDIQKFRTPKGIDWIKREFRRAGIAKPEAWQILAFLQDLRAMNVAMWAEGVSEVISAPEDGRGFIITDHPVTAYNRGCYPASKYCGYPRDPPVWMIGTQTLFALDSRRLLVLTNLQYAKNPGQKAGLTRPRENARYWDSTMARWDATVRERTLTNEQVDAVNFILKKRARRYIAAPEEEWLYPDKRIKNQDWAKLGELLIPTSKALWKVGGELYVRYNDGSVYYQDAYGRRVQNAEDSARRKKEVEAGKERLEQLLRQRRACKPNCVTAH